jgi:hypothetical protein
MKAKQMLFVALRLIAAVIMLQTLYFKFTAQPESIYIFSRVGMEPWGRIATGIAELIAAVLLLVPATIAIGAAIGIGVMLGAVTVHLFVLGIVVQGDGGQLFIYALLVLVSCMVLLLRYKTQLYAFKQLLYWRRK